MSSVRFTTWGMTRDGEWFELPMPEHLTVARESLSSQGLPTPTARDYKDTTVAVAKHRPQDADTISRALAHLLPTPTVVDMGNNKTPEQWEEWKAIQRAKHKNGNGHGASLTQEVISLGASTPPLSTAGSTSSDDPHQAPPSPAPTDDPDCLPYSWSG